MTKTNNILDSIILESKLEYTKDFKDILLSIESDLSKELLKLLNNDDIDGLVQNKIDINNDNIDFINFLQDNRIEKDLKKLIGCPITLISRGMVYDNDTDFKKNVYKFFELEDDIELILGNIGDMGLLRRYWSGKEIIEIVKNIPGASWNDEIYGIVLCEMANGYVMIKETSIDIDFYQGKTPSSIKIGKFVTKLLPKMTKVFSNKDVEDFVNSYKSKILKKQNIFSNFKILKGEDIRKYYYRDCYIQGNGTLQNSCMRYAGCQEYFNIYCDNTKNVSMVILQNDDEKLLGRAILWNLDDGNTFMDRIYTTFDSQVNLFIEFACHNDWYYKTEQRYGGSIIIKNKNNKSIDPLEVTLEHYNFERVPYMDTMMYLKDNKISNKKFDDYCYRLTSTEGELCARCHGSGNRDCPECDGDGETRCSQCRRKVPEECSRCNGTSYVPCENCDGSGEILCDHN